VTAHFEPANPLNLPLDGILVVDMSQFLAGPLASLKLADMGARVIKVERPGKGDLSRDLYLSETNIDGINTLFHAINRNKQSFAADLKSQDDIAKLRKLLEKADVVIQNFRPGVIERLGLGYDEVRALNPKIVYASISGYGNVLDWQALPGQDLLAQAKSGLMWLSGDFDQPPVPMGLAVADIMAGNNALQGILAGLMRSQRQNIGALVEVSLIESALDLQFEVLTTYLNDGNQPPRRSEISNGHAYLPAPYGVYKTMNGYIAIAMTPVDWLGELLECTELLAFTDRSRWFTQRDEIKSILADNIRSRATSELMDIFVAADVWACEVLNWQDLFNSDAFRQLDFIQDLDLPSAGCIQTTRCPIRLDGHLLKSRVPAPAVGQHTSEIEAEFDLVAPKKTKS
jgi:crotonobetainyl-CoA:carnitine CoA-transferase CaiB-like acyl-CoA transferase